VAHPEVNLGWSILCAQPGAQGLFIPCSSLLVSLGPLPRFLRLGPCELVGRRPLLGMAASTASDFWSTNLVTSCCATPSTMAYARICPWLSKSVRPGTNSPWMSTSTPAGVRDHSSWAALRR
jgi:hypothetical protein